MPTSRSSRDASRKDSPRKATTRSSQSQTRRTAARSAQGSRSGAHSRQAGGDAARAKAPSLSSGSGSRSAPARGTRANSRSRTDTQGVSREELSAYSRSSYSHGRGGHRRHSSKRSFSPVKLIVILAVIVVAAGCGLFLFTRPVHATVDGTDYELPWNTTYSDLRDEGLVSAKDGNLVAVDGSLIEVGKGKPFKAYDSGSLVKNNGRRVRNGADVTVADGDDATEDSTISEKNVAWTWDIEDCGRQDTYNFSIGMWVTQGRDGVEETATGDISGKTAKVPTSKDMIPRMVRHYCTNKTGDQKVIALTFDDGPSEYTQQVLDTLTKYGAVATFYEVGNNIKEYPDLTRAVVAQGSEVGNHSLTHSVYYGTDNVDAVVSEVSQTNQIIQQTTGQTCTNIRPPGGFWSDQLWQPLDGNCTLCVGWSIDTTDWKRPGAEAIANTATKGESGDVILMHDGGGDRSQSVAALDTICKYYKDQGYTFVTISQMADIERQVLRDEGQIPAE